MTSFTSSEPEIVWRPQPAPAKVRLVLFTVLAIRIIAFVLGVWKGNSQRAWQIYFVNFLFWSGIAQGGVVMAAVYRITNARWGDQFRRIGEAMVSFLPLSFVLYLVLVFGGQSIFPWLHEPVHGRELWLSAPFLFGRDGLIFLLLLWVSYEFVYRSVRPDLGALWRENPGSETMSRWVERVTKDWKGWEEEVKTRTKKLNILTPVLLITFSVLYSLIGFDLVMALDPYWFSTLFGWIYFLHAFFAALVVITILAVLARKWFDMEGVFRTNQWHDMGRFVFGFCLLTGGFYWSQFLVIWYGNLPEETSFLIKRFYAQPWETLTWVYLIAAYMFPLAVFLSKRVKQLPGPLMITSLIILIALFLERYLAVVPFLWHESSIPFGIIEFAVTCGFGAAFALCWLAFAKVVPLVPAGFSGRAIRAVRAASLG